MISIHNNQEERILSLEHSLFVMNNTIQGSQTLFFGLQAEYRRTDEITTQHEALIPRFSKWKLLPGESAQLRRE